jgi:hypothetical protein
MDELAKKVEKKGTQAASISCIVHNAVFSDLSSGTTTASHQARFLKERDKGVMNLPSEKLG